MPESPQSAAEIQQIRFELEAINATQVLLVRDRAPHLLDEFMKLFAQTPKLAPVYLRIDGKRTQAEVLDALARDGVEMSQPTLSRRMRTLLENGLIDRVASPKTGDVYERNRIVERVLNVTRRLRE